MINGGARLKVIGDRWTHTCIPGNRRLSVPADKTGSRGVHAHRTDALSPLAMQQHAVYTAPRRYQGMRGGLALMHARSICCYKTDVPGITLRRYDPYSRSHMPSNTCASHARRPCFPHASTFLRPSRHFFFLSLISLSGFRFISILDPLSIFFGIVCSFDLIYILWFLRIFGGSDRYQFSVLWVYFSRLFVLSIRFIFCDFGESSSVLIRYWILILCLILFLNNCLFFLFDFHSTIFGKFRCFWFDIDNWSLMWSFFFNFRFIPRRRSDYLSRSFLRFWRIFIGFSFLLSDFLSTIYGEFRRF